MGELRPLLDHFAALEEPRQQAEVLYPLPEILLLLLCATLAGADDLAEIEIWGDGEQTRSFMYIDDCVQGTRLLMDSEVTEPLNIGTSEMVTINQLVDLAEAIGGVKLKRRYDLDAPKGVRGRNSDNTRILELAGWEPSTSLQEGMERTYAWVYDQLVARGY